MTNRITAPWADAVVAALNASQRSGVMHPFTCGNEHRMRQTLVAEEDGWHCPDDACDYRQDWAHAFMAQRVSFEGVVVWARREEVSRPDPMASELRRVREQLRETEDQLAEARRRIAELTSRREAVLIHGAITRIPDQPPDPDGGMCDPTLVPARPFTDIPTGDLL